VLSRSSSPPRTGPSPRPTDDDDRTGIADGSAEEDHMQFEEFVDQVADRIGMSRDEAESLVRATLRTLAERLSGGEAEDLRAQLPRQLQAELIPPQEQAQGFDVEEFAQRVAVRSGIDETDAGAGVVAVFSVLRDAVSPGEFDDVLSQLGRDFAELVDAAP
jgi:uncharacterized protein (DUF2267 family)